MNPETETILTTEEAVAYCQSRKLPVTIRRFRAAIKNREIEYLDFAQPGALRSKSKVFYLSAVERWIQSAFRPVSSPEPTTIL